MILEWVALIASVIGVMAGRRAVNARGGSRGGRGNVGLEGRGAGSGRGSGGQVGPECLEGRGTSDTRRGHGGQGDTDGTGGGGSGTGDQGIGGQRDKNGADGRGSGSGVRGSGGEGDTECSGTRGSGSGDRGDTDRSVIGEHITGASDEAECTGARDKTSKRRKRRVRDRDGENSECVHWDDEGRRIVPLGKEADPRSHRTRGYSPGGFGTYPAKPTVVRIKGNQIDCSKALRNILAITRVFWPDGCVGTRDIDKKSPEFWHTCTEEFLRYYTWDPKVSTEQEARASICGHMRNNLRHTVADDKERADEWISTHGGTYANYRPPYVKPGVWSRLCEYWVSDEFKKRSDAGKAARKKVKAPHTSGARSFDRRARDYMKKHDGKLDKTEVYKDCHTYKNKEKKGKWITKEAKNIIERYKEICLKNGIDPKNTHLQIWVKAVGGVKKNRIPGHPRLRASDIYGPEEGVPPPRKGEGNSSLNRLQDDLFLRVVDETFTQARANPEEYSLTPEQIRVLAHNMVEGYTSLPADHPNVKETRHAIIRVAVDVLNNLYKNDQPEADKDKTDQPGADKGKAIDIGDGADVDQNGRDDESTDSEDRDMNHPYIVVPRGGPVIKG
nr:PREDICTED: uncharacterized protein LOC108207182 [Daucus carota subsp. sativus]